MSMSSHARQDPFFILVCFLANYCCYFSSSFLPARDLIIRGIASGTSNHHEGDHTLLNTVRSVPDEDLDKVKQTLNGAAKYGIDVERVRPNDDGLKWERSPPCWLGWVGGKGAEPTTAPCVDFKVSDIIKISQGSFMNFIFSEFFNCYTAGRTGADI